jgi:hypothetical protein
MKSIHRCLAFAALFGLGTAHAAIVTCTPKNPHKAWVKKITINTSTKRVMLEVEALRTLSGVSLANVDATLENSDETQFDEPIYLFNAYPRPGVEVTNLFKLFKGLSEWRLIDVGVAFVGGKPTLRALGSSEPYDCSKR